jgi:gluconate 2-dehydrogenase gamma chain
VSSNDRPTSRRDFLFSSVALTPIALAPVATTLATSLANGDALAESAPTGGPLRGSAPAADHPASQDYRPAFFTSDEWAFINAACARLIPADEHGPSALELGVPQYIDRQMGTPWADGAIWYMQGPFFEAAAEFGYQSQLTPRQQYRLGIAAVDRLCQERLRQPFAALTPAQQDDVLKQIEKGSLTSADLPLKTFFSGFLMAHPRSQRPRLRRCAGKPAVASLRANCR